MVKKKINKGKRELVAGIKAKIKYFPNLKIKIAPKLLIIPLLTGLIAAFLYYQKGKIIVAMVNGTPISRIELINELEKQGKKSILEGLINKTLILQEAKKQKIEVSRQEIEGEITKIEKRLLDQGMEINRLLALQGMTKADLEKEIEIQKLAEKLAEKNINISEEEIKDYLQKNKSLFDDNMSQESKEASAINQLREEKLATAIQSLIESLRSQAKIIYF